MKMIITGSLGNISKPLTQNLVAKGHSVTVISSKADKQKEVESLGATAAIGSLEDVNFLSSTFKNADAVYCMVPPNYFRSAIDPIEYYRVIANNYAQAVQKAGVKRVVHLSSFGAHLDKGTGFILGSHYAEKILGAIPNISLTNLRPASFHYNLLHFIHMVKGAGFIASNYGGDDRLQFVSPTDIATVAAEEMGSVTASTRYVCSDELTGNEVAAILGEAIGKPKLPWIVISAEQMQAVLEGTGVPVHIAEKLVELNDAFHKGLLSEDYLRNKPVLGTTKMTDFAREFAKLYHAA